MAATATLQRKAQREEAERAPEVSAAVTSPVMPSRITALPGRSALIQAQSFVSSPDDAAEREADKVAAHVVSMPEPSAKASTRAPNSVMRSPLIVQRRASPRQAAPRRPGSAGSTNVMQQVKAAASGGFALSKKTRAYLEPRFKADFSNVRLHTDAKAKDLSNKVGARAFTFGRHIFFNEGQYNPDSKAGLELLAHELTHTIQQRETIQRKQLVNERTDPHVQRIFGALGDAVSGAIDAVGEFVGDVVQIVKDFIAEHADVLPGFKILCLVLGYNPVNDAPAPGGGRAILKELSTFIPFGDKVYEALNNHGIIDKGGAFIDTQIANFKALANAIIGAISSFFGSLGPGDALRPLGAWNRLKSSFTPVIASMKTAASGLINGFIDLVREVILPPMARWAAANIPHWDLLMGVLGVNPVTNGGESPTMQLIGAFMKLIGQEEVWENIKKGNAIGRAWAWFQTAMSGAKAMVSGIPGEVMATIRSFTIMDVLTVVGAAGKILGLFASIGGKFISWAGGTVIELLKIVIDVVAPGVMVYIQRAAGAFQTIVRNPIGFVGNLVRAAMQGFRQFAANFLTHLQASLVGWLTGALGGTGVYIPQGLNLREILKFVLSVLGLTWANIRQKLVRATNETTVVALETGMDIVRTLVTEGPAAAWQKILETLTNLKQMAIDAIMDFVKQRVVQAAVTRLLSMLSPAGAFIQAVIAIYNTIMFFVERLRQIAQVAASFIDAIATIASGNIGPAANRVETTMAGLLTLVISFLARIAGLGRVADAITGLIARVRAPINTAIDRVVAWIVAQARRLGAAVMRGARRTVAAVAGWWRERTQFRNQAGESHSLYFNGQGDAAQMMMASNPQTVRSYLDAYPNKTSPDYQTARSIFDRESRIIYTPQARNADENQRRREVAAAIGRIGAAFSRLSGNPPNASDYPATTPPNYGNYTIQYITGSAPGGSTPGVGRDTGTPGWDQVYDAGLTRAADRWVQMHVISERLGGQGVPANLVPAPNSVNSGPFRSFEHQVLNLARARDAATNIANVVWFQASVSKAGVFARSISAQAGVYFWNGTNRSWIKNDSYTLHARAAIPAPQLAAAAAPRYSLNFSSGTELRSIGINANLVNIIRQNRMYSSMSVFKTRVKAAANTANIPSADPLVDGIAADGRIVLNGP